jgi:hypothetical protein
MNITWVVATGYQIDPAVDLDAMKNIGPIWGSWSTWRSCGTDNVVCHNLAKARELLQRDFQKNCNFYTPEQYHSDLGRPSDVRYYGGKFDEEIDHIEDVVSMHLSTAASELVLMLGFDFPPMAELTDRFELHKLRNRYGLMRSLIVGNPDTQYVLIDHPKQLEKTFQDLPNLTCDNLGNVLQLLAQ